MVKFYNELIQDYKNGYKWFEYECYYGISNDDDIELNLYLDNKEVLIQLMYDNLNCANQTTISIYKYIRLVRTNQIENFINQLLYYGSN